MSERECFVPVGNLFALELHVVDRSKGGVVLPDTVKDRADSPTEEPMTGTVIAAGAQCRYVKAGDRVILTGRMPWFKWAGRKVHIGNEANNVVGIERRADGGPHFEVIDWHAGEVSRLEVLGSSNERGEAP